jgi:hypothetical protein
LKESQAIAEGRVMLRQNDATHNDIGVTIDVFCETMEDDIGTLK